VGFVGWLRDTPFLLAVGLEYRKFLYSDERKTLGLVPRFAAVQDTDGLIPMALIYLARSLLWATAHMCGLRQTLHPAARDFACSKPKHRPRQVTESALLYETAAHGGVL
jgi:hypothetical protein